MSEKRVIEDPGQWRAGDEATYEYTTGYPITGKLWLDGSDRGLYLGPQIVRDANGRVDVTHITVTRTVEPIPEPTEPWALVRFAGGEVMWLVAVVDGVRVWTDPEGSSWEWVEALDAHGAPVAVSLPRWSDEVEPWRAAVRASLVVLSSRLSDAGAREVVENNLPALLAEGGEA